MGYLHYQFAHITMCAPTLHTNRKNTMKKRYTSPFAEIIELGTTNLIAASIPGRPNTGNKDDDWADEYDAAERRGSWDDMWQYM